MPNRRSLGPKICKAIQESTVILIQFRILLAELAFTIAALYGLFHAVTLLAQ